MKARVQTGTVLICCFEESAHSALEKFFSARRVSVRYAGKQDLNTSLSTLLGLPESGQNIRHSDSAFSAPALIFSAFSDHALDRILDDLKGAGLASGAMRAIVTPHNRNWELGALLKELSEERAAMQAQSTSYHIEKEKQRNG